MHGEPWQPEDIALLRRLWSEGETAAAIGAKLGGLSRSAVLGKIFRLRLGAAGKPPAANAADKPPGRRRAGKAAPLPPAKAGRRGKTLLELTNACCRWPYKRPGADKYFFCGAPEANVEAGLPYCPRHMKRAYLVPPPLAMRKAGAKPLSNKSLPSTSLSNKSLPSKSWPSKSWTVIKPLTAEERHARDWRRRQRAELKRVFGGR